MPTVPVPVPLKTNILSFYHYITQTKTIHVLCNSTAHSSCWESNRAAIYSCKLLCLISLPHIAQSDPWPPSYDRLSPYYLHIITAISAAGFTSMCVTQTKQTWISLRVGRRLKLAINGLGYLFGVLPVIIRQVNCTSYGNCFIGPRAEHFETMLVRHIWLP